MPRGGMSGNEDGLNHLIEHLIRLTSRIRALSGSRETQQRR